MYRTCHAGCRMGSETSIAGQVSEHFIAVCPHCRWKNRLRPGRVGEPRCGHCGKELGLVVRRPISLRAFINFTPATIVAVILILSGAGGLLLMVASWRSQGVPQVREESQPAPTVKEAAAREDPPLTAPV